MLQLGLHLYTDNFLFSRVLEYTVLVYSIHVQHCFALHAVRFTVLLLLSFHLFLTYFSYSLLLIWYIVFFFINTRLTTVPGMFGTIPYLNFGYTFVHPGAVVQV